MSRTAVRRAVVDAILETLPPDELLSIADSARKLAKQKLPESREVADRHMHRIRTVMTTGVDPGP